MRKKGSEGVKSTFDSSCLDEFGGHLTEFILPIKSSAGAANS